MTTKKRSKDEGTDKSPAKKKTTTSSSRAPAGRTGGAPARAPAEGRRPAKAGKRPTGTGTRTPRPVGGSPRPGRPQTPGRAGGPQTSGRAGGGPQTPGARRVPARSAPSPRIRASHSTVPDAPASGGGRKLKAISVDTGQRRGTIALKAPGAGARKAPLAAPKRTAAVRRAPEAEPREAGPSSAARELALALAAAAIDKKAIGIEILDVTGKVDYADFLVVMTGRSDRHVHAIATGIEEAMRRRKLAPLSIEGLTAANWVLIDFSDVVVHVFQEEARALYDIEGLWIDAGRVPVPDADKAEGGATSAPRPYVD